MMNTPYKSKDKNKIEEMTLMQSQIFSIALLSGKPILQTIIYLNENFEDIYSRNTPVETLKILSTELGISAINKENPKN